uniref:Uncharacterized protein n=1 Tax=Xenopus tropicalis TaxID=8364 RepID=A0A1B8XUP8_XENTR
MSKNFSSDAPEIKVIGGHAVFSLQRDVTLRSYVSLFLIGSYCREKKARLPIAISREWEPGLPHIAGGKSCSSYLSQSICISLVYVPHIFYYWV